MNKRAGAAPTIIDVARRAGVSIKTVSRVMNKEPTVHADTRARVQEAVAASGVRLCSFADLAVEDLRVPA